MGLKSFVSSIAFLSLSGTILQAAPMLRLSSATIGPIAAPTSGVTSVQTLEAFNAGDGALNLTVSSSVPWVTTAMGATRSCRTILTAVGQTCSTIQVTVNTASLPQGLSTGFLTVSDPNAVDAPQTVTVTVRVGTVSADAAPGGSPVDVPFTTSNYVFATPASQADWLSVETDAYGSFRFDYPYRIRFKPSATLAQGTYTNSIALSGSTNPVDNQTIPVSLRVTTQPIAVPNTDRLRIRIAEGAPKLAWPISPLVSFTNPGAGTLQVQTPTITGASWLAYEIADPYVANGFHFTVDPTGVAQGTTSGSIAFAANSVNGTVTVPVDLTVVAKGTPLINYQGVLNNATFEPGDTAAQGDIMVVKGEQLSFSAFAPGQAPPLATKLGGTSVLVNGVAAPLFYTSYSQIAFQIPVDTALGTAIIQVQRDDGSTSNKASVQVAARAPRIIVVTNQNGSVNSSSNPAHTGEVITLWSIGLGATSPSVATGAAAPSAEPFARVTPDALVAFGSSLSKVTATPQFAALAPGFAGLYQVNVQVPSDSPKGAISVQVAVTDSASNNQTVYIQ